MTPDELTAEMLRLSKLLDAALDYVKLINAVRAEMEFARTGSEF